MPSEQTKHNLSGETGLPSNPMADPVGLHRGVTLQAPPQQVGHLYGDRGLSQMTPVLLSLPWGRLPSGYLRISFPSKPHSATFSASQCCFLHHQHPPLCPHTPHTHRQDQLGLLLRADQAFHFLRPAEKRRGWRPQRHGRESSNLASAPPRKRGFVRIKLGNGHKAPATWHSIKHSYYYFMVAVTQGRSVCSG